MKEQLILDALEKDTGKDIAQWTRIMDESGLGRFSDIISFLQKRHELKYKTAHSLAHLYLENKEINSAHLHYTSEGRGGKVIYRSPGVHFELDWEFGGGNSVAIIYIPAVEQWEAQTYTPLSERQKILDFIGAQVVKDQTGGKGSYTIDSIAINILE